MRKIINESTNVVDEMLEGFIAAYNKYYYKHPLVNGVISKQRRHGKVSLVIGGGSGHEPMFSGFVGKGLADAASCGNIFASPDPKNIYETAKAVENGKGVLFVYGCYAGDNLNFDMAEEFLNAKGIETAHVRVQDDIASAPEDKKFDRRGIAGDVFVIKIAGAACDAGLSLEEVTRVTEKARDCTRTIGVATAPAQLPGAAKPIFELGENEIEYGMGLHGEKGVERTTWKKSDVLVERMYSQIMLDSGIRKGDQVCVLINGLGSTTIMELSIVFRKLKQLLDQDGVILYDADLNNYCTSLEMGGFSISLMKLDNELKKYYDMPCYCPYYAKGAVEICEEYEDEEAKLIAIQKNKEKKKVELKERKEYVRKKHYDKLDAEDCRQMLLYIADKILSAEPYLTSIDSEIGDGDHGFGMAAGMKNAKEVLLQMEGETNVYSIFEAAGKAMLLSMGGASGVIFGSLYMEGAMGMKMKEYLGAQDLYKMEQKSLKAIQERGKAQVGDKTMVDALEPAVRAMEASYLNGLEIMLINAEQAALKGVEDTKTYIAKFGRAKSLGQRAIGFQDAGATSTWLIFQGMREFVEGKVEVENI